MSAHSKPASSALSLRCELPADRAFVGLGSALAVKLARQLGFPPLEAARIGEEVDAATAACLDGPEPGSLDIDYDAAGGRLRIRVRRAGVDVEIARPLPPA